ncbi:octopamine receptor-like [Centruroides sculpturatus]|uniref:octopamine receptor-like n=1 Tax=Centruroides sculpturatus TaxID=218467 RepID=UPI000C6DE9CE|nr:octopamine receptor-like [Centruroides sculpturatus]XP_023218555.1 octopamine receptor-like [Centruroides sculpturatus]
MSTNRTAYISSILANTTCYEAKPDVTTAVIVIVDAILAVGAIFGNLVVMTAVYKYRQLRTVTNVFVVSLAAADLLVGLNVPYYVLFYFNTPLSCNKYGCLLRYCSTIYASGCSMLSLVGVAVDRYVAIIYALSYPRIMTFRYATLYIVIVWLYMGVISSMPLFGIGETFKPGNECDLYYTHTSTYALSVVAAHVLFTLVSTTVLYGIIFREAWKQSLAVAALEINHRVHKEAKTARTMALVLGVCLIGFLPYFCSITVRYIDGIKQEQVDAVKRWMVCLYFGKSALNPIVYGWKNRDFRSAFKRLLLTKNRPERVN